MALQTFIITSNVKAPYVVATARGDRPQDIRLKQFRKGEIIKGELKHANNKPAFVLVEGALVIPITAVRKLVTADINSSGADGTSIDASDKKPGILAPNSNPKVKYIDAMLIGALVGLGGVYLAERQGWIKEPDKKYKLYGALGGALLGAYAVYRFKTAKPKQEKKD